jgi:hypothetical protein
MYAGCLRKPGSGERGQDIGDRKNSKSEARNPTRSEALRQTNSKPKCLNDKNGTALLKIQQPSSYRYRFDYLVFGHLILFRI